MSTSVRKKILFKRSLRYLGVSAFLVVFNLIYGLFAHGVESLYMDYAFLVPLVLGTLVCLVLSFLPEAAETASRLWRMGIATLSVGFLLHGVFDIYGSASSLVPVFFWAAGILLLAGLAFYVSGIVKGHGKSLNP